MDITELKMRKTYLHIIVALLLGQAVFAQTQKAWEEAAAQAYAFKDYYAAMVYWQNALEFDEERLDLLYNCADAARHFNSYRLSAKYYQQIVDAEVNGEYPDATFYLAEMKFILGEYETAKTYYEMYLSEYEDDDEKLTAKAQRQLSYMEFAMEESNVEYEDVDLELLGPEINTPFSEFGPYLKGDSLYYSSLRFENKKDTYRPKRPITKVLLSKEGAHGVPLDDEFNMADLHTSHTSMNADHSRVYFTICEWMNGADIRCDLYYREIDENGEFGESVALEMLNDSAATSTQPNIAVDKSSGKEVLYFVSDREGGKGGLDIWYAEMDNEGNFGAPANFEAVNTEFNEITPFYHSGSGVFYFSSDGWPGLGGYDIFRTEYRDWEWLEPENMSVPFNSSYNDLYYMELDNEEGAYFASNRSGGYFIDEDREACCNDIYRAEFLEIDIDLLAMVLDKLSREDLNGATVTLVDLSDPENPRGMTNLDGNDFYFPLERARDYVVVAEKEGYFPDSAMISTKRIRKSDTIKQDLLLRTTRLDLEVYTFDKRNNEALNGTTIKIIDKNDPSSELIVQMDDESNELILPIDRDKDLIVVATKRGYSPDSVMINTAGIDHLNTITEKLYLGLGSLEDFLPLTLFFDNDEPDKRTYKTRTTLRYEQTYPPYYARKQEFINAYASPLDGDEKEQAETEVANFFDKEVKQGNEHLRTFIALLEKALIDDNEKVEIVLQGYASPRASRAYNDALSKRRISSVMNQVTKYSDGKLTEYIENKQLVIKEEPFGSRRAPRYVSGSIRDERNSIYSIPASRERRVEIIQVKRDEGNRR